MKIKFFYLVYNDDPLNPKIGTMTKYGIRFILDDTCIPISGFVTFSRKEADELQSNTPTPSRWFVYEDFIEV